MKKTNIFFYIGILIIGILIGWLLFGGQQEAHVHEQVTETTKKPKMWTCSMHPQIMQPEPGDCPICGMDLIPAQENGEALAANEFKMTENAMALANIETIKVSEEAKNHSSLKLTGTIEANEKTNAIQTAHFGGRIEKLFVNFTGEEVRYGQKLALIYAPELVTTQQELLTAARMKTSQPELYKAVRNKLKLWKLSEAQIQQIENSQQVITQFPIYANVSGVVTEKMVEEGNHVKEGAALFKVSNLQTVWASFDAYEDQLTQLQTGNKITITVNAFPNEEIPAKITFIDPVLNAKTRTVDVKVVLNNKNDKLKPGMFVTGVLAKEVKQTDVIIIPKSAVLWTGKRSLVYVKTSPTLPVFEAREVVLGATMNDSYEVVSGVSASDEIVVNGTFTVDAAAQLQGKKSMMNTTDKTRNTLAHSIQIDTNVEKALQPVISAYFELKDALVASETSLAFQKNVKLQKALENMQAQHRKKIEEYWLTMHKSSKSINESTSLEQQRKSFEIISAHLIALVQQFEKYPQTFFVQFCPMANNDKGAYWLSTEAEIRNPYFGEAMLTCGNVSKVLE